MNKKRVYAIILAGGRGTRMGADIPKQYLKLGSKPVLAYSLETFEKSVADKIFIVCAPAFEDQIRSEILKPCGITKFAGFAESGDERVRSVKNGIGKALEGIPAGEYDNICLMIHDGARPLVSSDLIERCITAADTSQAVIPGIPLKDTIKELSGTNVTATPDRNSFCAVQTPQCFAADVILRAYEGFETAAEGFIPTDDASLVERFTDVNVSVIPGEEDNIKITTPLDMKIAGMILQGQMKMCQ